LLKTLATFELWALGALKSELRFESFAPRLASLPRRHAWQAPKGSRALRFESGVLVCEDADGAELHRMTREAWLAGEDPYAQRCAHEVRDGIALVLEDDNPIALWEAHPDKLGNALNLGERDARVWVDGIGEALELIAEQMPTLYEEMKLFVQRIVPVGYHDRLHLSASYAEAIGTIYVTLHPQRMVMAEALIHEFSHNKLNALFEVDEVLKNAFTSLHSSPVRPDPRPLHGVLLAAHAFLPVATLYERMLDSGHPRAQSEDFRRRLAKIVSSNHEASSVVLESGQPTVLGKGLLEEIARLDAHFVERFYDESVDATDLG
jgi:HEXXH motif-containing protein